MKKRKTSRKILSFLLTAMLFSGLAGCGSSSEPCNYCGSTPTHGYKNDYTKEKEYYCDRCSSGCGLCSNEASHHYTSGLGFIVFVCDKHYEDVQEFNQRY